MKLSATLLAFVLIFASGCASFSNWSYREGLSDNADLSNLDTEEKAFFEKVNGRLPKRAVGEWLIADTKANREPQRKKLEAMLGTSSSSLKKEEPIKKNSSSKKHKKQK